jgi:hypothetical protein
MRGFHGGKSSVALRDATHVFESSENRLSISYSWQRSNETSFNTTLPMIVDFNQRKADFDSEELIFCSLTACKERQSNRANSPC